MPYCVAGELCSPAENRGGGKEIREREVRERKGINRFDLKFFQNFELCSEKFEYESCLEFQDLQLLFLPLLHLRLIF